MGKEQKFIYYLTFISVIFSIAVFAVIRTKSLPEKSDYGVDGFYHMTMAENFSPLALEKKFDKTQISLWKDRFYNKELAFHGLLAVIQKVRSILNLASGPPYNFSGIIIFSLIICGITFVYLYKGVKAAFLIPPLMMCVSPLFLYRMSMIRPHTISVIIFSCVLAAFIFIEKKSMKRIILFILGILYAYFYSSPHLILIPVAAALFAVIISDRNLKAFYTESFSASFAVLGVIAGLIFHPQFPNTFYLWYVQGIMVAQQILGLDHGVGLGLELLSPNAETYIQNSGIYILAALNIFLYIKYFYKSRYDKSALILIFSQIVMTLGFSFSERCIEYAVPAGVIGTAFMIGIMIDEKWQKSRFKISILMFSAVFIIYFSTLPLQLSWMNQGYNETYYEFSEWAEKNIPEKSYIAQIRWGEFPFLIQAAPHCVFSMGLDPMFVYAVHPEKIKKLEAFRQLKNPLSLKEIYEITNTNLIFVSRNDIHCAKHIGSTGAKVLYSDEKAFLFLLPPEKVLDKKAELPSENKEQSR